MSAKRGEYRSIHAMIVDGPDFQAFTPEAKLVFFTLKMVCGLIGIAVLPAYIASLAERTGYDEQIVTDAFGELVGAGWVEAERNVVWIVRGLQFEPQVSPIDPKHRLAVLNRLNAMPNLPIIARFRDRYAAWIDAHTNPSPRPIEGPSEALGSKEPEPLPEPEQEPEPETKALARRGNTLAVIEAHLAAIGLDAIQKARKGEARKLGGEFVFSYWAKRLRHDSALYDEHRENALVRALKANRENVSELLYVIDGAAGDDWASRDLGRHDVKTLFRDRTSIEKYATKCAGYRNNVPHPTWIQAFGEAA